MSKEVVSFMLAGKSGIKDLQMKLILQCAPFLKGIKVACIMNMEKGACGKLEVIFDQTGICYRILKRNENTCLVFLYRRDTFSAYLRRPEVREFLRVYGYESDDMDQMLDRLSERIGAYEDGEIHFPHEIGAFLDYPIDDVKCFIEKEGKDSLMTGYWKVYNNPARAQLTFWAYDKAITSAVNEFLIGMSIRDIVCSAA